MHSLLDTSQRVGFPRDTEDDAVTSGVIFDQEIVRSSIHWDRVNGTHEIGMEEIPKGGGPDTSMIDWKKGPVLFSFAATLTEEISWSWAV
jgi:hypothetical protein